jgi:hypothetical protein
MTQIEMIEKYLEGKMSTEEKFSFEAELKSNEQLQKAFFKISSLIKGIEGVGRKEVAKDLERLENSLPGVEAELNKRNTYFNSLSYRMAAAITAILVVVGSFYFLNPTGNTAPAKLFDSNFAPYMNNVSSMTRSNAGDFGNRELAFAAYDNYNFNEAAAYFDALLEVEEDASLLLYSGNAELSLGNAEKAISRLTKLFNEFDAFDNQAAWYLSLAHLKNENAEEAAGYLLHLLATENSYTERAANLFISIEESLNLLGNGTAPLEKAVVYDVRVDEFAGPPDGADAIDEAGALSKRFGSKNAEWGVVITEKDGESLIFINNRPMDLTVGSNVLIKKLPGRGRGRGSAIIIGIL